MFIAVRLRTIPTLESTGDTIIAATRTMNQVARGATLKTQRHVGLTVLFQNVCILPIKYLCAPIIIYLYNTRSIILRNHNENTTPNQADFIPLRKAFCTKLRNSICPHLLAPAQEETNSDGGTNANVRSAFETTGPE